MNKRNVGNTNEQFACDYLEQNGVSINDRNFACKFGEIDIIGYDISDGKKYLVFFEVKYRKTLVAGYSSEAVDFRKQRKISMVADFYRVIRKIEPYMPVRFDVIAIDGDKIVWIKNAFSYIARC